ncbi:hypothetical protein BX616_005707, partial [Lobosporangium transversale]
DKIPLHSNTPYNPYSDYGTGPEMEFDPDFIDDSTMDGLPDPERDLPYVIDHTVSPLENLTKNFTIVTAASANHFCALESFLYSLSEVFEGLERTETRPTLVVYNLGGMTNEQLAQLQYLKDNQYIDEYKDFDYDQYPAFWDINVARGEYGWKAGIIKENTPSSSDPKFKSLTIHIATDHVGPHGMPLVYGSTPDKVGVIKGTVKFATNYDCRGRDIVIMYEAKAEAQWTALENKKVVNHHTEEILGHQIWHFPLEHTKPGGFTVIAGDYEKEFEVPLIHPLALTRPSTPLLPGSVKAPFGSTATHIAPVPQSPALLLPSSSYSPNAKIKYTIRAILHRPFPCISDIEASQEVWVLQSCLAPASPPSPPKSPLHSPASPRSPHYPNKEERNNGIEKATDQPSPSPDLQTQSSKQSSPASSVLTSPFNSLTVPTKAIKSALNMLPTIDLSRPKQLLSFSIPPLSPKPNPPPSPPETDREKASTEGSNGDAKASSLVASPTAEVSRPQNSVLPLSPSTSVSSSSSRYDEPESEDSMSDDENSANYTGVWEPFGMAYSCSIPSETVHLGQTVPLTIRFKPNRRNHRRRHDGKSNKFGSGSTADQESSGNGSALPSNDSTFPQGPR